jgi:cell wall-associated NlpC family hydrolase
MSRTRLRQFTLGAFLPTITAVGLTLGLAWSSPAQAASPTAAPDRTTVSARSHATAGFRILGPGDAGGRIVLAKRILRLRSRSDVYGHALQRRIVGFKRKHHLAATPMIGPPTWHRLQHLQRRERITHKRHVIIRVARAHVGDPYVYGAAGPHAFDCSGFVQYVYRHATGRLLPRVGSAQYAVGRPEPRGAARPGDLVAFFSGGYIYHVAIYAGHGMIYHAPHTGTVVQRQAIFSGNVRFARLLPRP